MTIKLVKMSIRNVFSFLELTILLSSVFVLQLSSAVAHKSYSPDFIDVTILDVNASINETYRGAAIHVYVAVEATWDVIDFSSFWVAVFYDGSLIDMETVVVLHSGHEIFTFNFTWNTSGVEIGSYIISAMTSTSIMPYIDGYVQILPVGNINTKQGYPTIQEAINNASKGDTIFASSGTYYENVVVNKSLSLVGEDRDSTVIDGNETGFVVRIMWTSHVTISGFTLRRSGRELIHLPIGVSYPESGIFLEEAQECVISNNVIINNLGGATLHRSPNNVVKNNIMMNNEYCISLSTAFTETVNNIIQENTIANNTYGLVFDLNDNWGHSHDNYIYHNNFINNTNQVYLTDSFNNTWDNDCEGNYWSNYNGTDSDGDGIGDTPYIIDGNNTDNHPLMNPYWLPGDVNHDLKIDIYDVVRITGVYGSQQGDPNWNCHSDIAEPYGIINIYDVVTCTKDYRKEYTP